MTPVVVEANGSVPRTAWSHDRPDARCNHKSLLRAGMEASRNASPAMSTTKIASTAPGPGAGSRTGDSDPGCGCSRGAKAMADEPAPCPGPAPPGDGAGKHEPQRPKTPTGLGGESGRQP